MKKIFVDKEFFRLKRPTSINLITGLNSLTKRGIVIFSNAEFNSSQNHVTTILEFEQISIDKHEENNAYDFGLFVDDIESIRASEKVFGDSEKSFDQLVNLLLSKIRTAEVTRKTKETDISIRINLDGEGKSEIETGIGFFDHMLDQIARHSNIDLSINVKGDLKIDEHHTVEDTGLTLGEAILKALGDKKGIKRFGFCLPMDDSIALTSIDFSGRPYLNFKVKFNRELVGEFPTELVEEFFRALATSMKANIFVKAKGKNDHHKIEAIFKSFAKSLNEALRFDERAPFELPSTKGIL